MNRGPADANADSGLKTRVWENKSFLPLLLNKNHVKIHVS